MTKPGTVFLIGTGPGDPGLVTVRALELVATADAVVYDRLIPELLLRRARPGARLIDVGKEPKKHRRSQDEINEVLVEEARAGRTVARLKGGDPFVFGRGGEEALALAAAGIPFVVVPGVTSAVAVPAYAGIPVTHRGVSTEFAVVTGHEDPAKETSSIDWCHLAKGVGTAVFLMGVKNLPQIVEQLVKHGRAPGTPAAIIHRGCTGRQRVLVSTLGAIATAPGVEAFTPPSITVVGEVVRLRDQLGPWFERLPLFGATVLCTRPEDQGLELATGLARLGARPLVSPLVTVAPRARPDGLEEALSDLGRFPWVFFTSQNGVRLFFEHLERAGLDARAFARSQLGCIGSATAQALRERGLRADLVPARFTAEGLLEALAPEDLTGRRVLVPRAAQARPTLVDGLRRRGADVLEVQLYDTLPARALAPEAVEALAAGEVDVALLFSPSAAEAWHALTGEVRRPPVLAIGPVTGARARELGLEVAAEADEHTEDGLVDRLRAWWTERAAT